MQQVSVSARIGIGFLCYSTLFQKNPTPLKRYICRNYLHKRCSQDSCPRYHDPSLVSLPVLDVARYIESSQADEPPLCTSLYARPCTNSTCSGYHPEVDRPVLAKKKHFSSFYQGNRGRVICGNFLRSRCYNQNCNLFHFKLPTVRIPFHAPRLFLNSFCRVKKLFPLNASRPLLPSSRGLAMPLIPTRVEEVSNPSPHRPTSLCLLPHHPRMGRGLAFIRLNATRGTMDIVPGAGTARCSIFTG